ncbi:MAG: NAD-dependent epimerase/dehydratase family protein [Armatimonadetes bacterium]|nr:NAD-dependent epimerase/dehydratase family protein [Armatimonadota bacterium]
MKVLITGGAGFVGRHLTGALIEKGDAVCVLDALVSQVHGQGGRAADLHPAAEFIRGDVRDIHQVRQALEGVDAVFHLAAQMGVDQSMDEIYRFVDGNTLGTAVLLQGILERRNQIRKLVVASSMTLYGEGCGLCARHGVVDPGPRSPSQLEQRDWETRCPHCGDNLAPAPTPETKLPAPTSVYAVSKRDQEELCLSVGRAYGIPTVALRYFNIYGPGQALGNPYTGVLSIFCNHILNGQPALIYEDGRQSRDFVHVKDVVQANILALEADEANYQVFNVSSRELWTVGEIARMVAEELNAKEMLAIPGLFRAGDIRHCHADVTRICTRLGYQPRVGLRQGLPDVVRWAQKQETPVDTSHPAKAGDLPRAARELAAYDLAR